MKLKNEFRIVAVILFTAIMFTNCSSPKGNKASSHAYQIKAVNLNQIELTDNFWLPKIKTIQHKTIAFALNKCKVEGRMDNFLIAGGVEEGSVRGVMPFDDTDLYKIIEGASYSLIMSPDSVLENYVDSLISIIAIGQETDGYLTTYKTIDTINAPAHWCPAGGRWEDLECSHELYNSGHMFEAAAAYYAATGKSNFLNIALKNADLLVKVFGENGTCTKVPGHQIVETGLIKLYQITQNEDYLKLSKRFLDERGDSTKHALGGEYIQDHKPVIEQDEVVGHAVRAVYMYAGMTDIAALYGDSAYRAAVDALWENMVSKKMYITGGIGACHEGEAFGENYELPNLTAYSETCAAIGSVYWNYRLFLLTGEAKYLDVLERTLYNSVISGISLDGEAFFYPNPLESDGKYDFNKGHCTRAPWFDCSCCPTNLIRFIPSVPNLMYATEGDKLFVNLYVSNNAEIEVNGSVVSLVQTTNYPWEGKVKLIVTPEAENKFELKLHIPGWVRDETVPSGLYHYAEKSGEKPQFYLNGKPIDADIADGFLSIRRAWKEGDTVEMDFPMEVKEVIANDKVENLHNCTSFEYGPLVYCAEEVDNKKNDWKISKDEKFKVSFHPELLNGVNELESDDLTLIPYYAWSNRGVNKMKVWLPLKK